MTVPFAEVDVENKDEMLKTIMVQFVMRGYLTQYHYFLVVNFAVDLL